jgi:hypothetical protein
MSDTMHDSTSGGFRPRQRTFTSCTECRRRKQKCNQTKDRPCSNCARRYPPPICTYQSSRSDLSNGSSYYTYYNYSPTPPPVDHDVRVESHNPDHYRSNHSYREGGSSESASAYQYYGGQATTLGSASQSLYNTSPIYESSPSSSKNGSRYYAANSNNYQASAVTTSGGDYYPVTTGYYQNDHIGYSTADSSHDYTYLATSGDQQWLPTADPDVFAGTSTSEYFYVDETEPSRTSGPRS